MSEDMTMVEKVARAIHAVVQKYNAPAVGYAGPGWVAYEGEARAAIAAMRNPTEEMLSAGDSMMPQIAKGEDISTGYDALREAYPAMIDAALSSAPLSSGPSGIDLPERG